MAKLELKSAYRKVPVHSDDRWLLGMALDDKLCVNTTPPFGLRSAPMIFSAVARGLAFIIKSRGVEDLGELLNCLPSTVFRMQEES